MRNVYDIGWSVSLVINISLNFRDMKNSECSILSNRSPPEGNNAPDQKEVPNWKTWSANSINCNFSVSQGVSSCVPLGSRLPLRCDHAATRVRPTTLLTVIRLCLVCCNFCSQRSRCTTPLQFICIPLSSKATILVCSSCLYAAMMTMLLAFSRKAVI